MKNTIFALAVTLAASAFAQEYSWTGGGSDTSSWNDAANWEPQGVPGGGDRAIFSADAKITDGIEIASGELTLDSVSGIVEIAGVISGDGALYSRCLGKSMDEDCAIVLSCANTYAGGTKFAASALNTSRAKYGIWLGNRQACGSAKKVWHYGGDLYFNSSDAEFGYEFVPMEKGTVQYFACQPTVVDSIAGDEHSGEIWLRCQNKTATFTVKGLVGGVDTSFLNVRPRVDGTKSLINLLGGVIVKNAIRMDTTGDGWSAGYTAFDGNVTAASLNLDYGSYRCLANDVLNENTVLLFKGYSDGEKGRLDINGFNQTLNRIESGNSDESAANHQKARVVYSAQPAVITLKPSQSQSLSKAAFSGKVTVVMDAEDSAYAQTSVRRVSDTTGDLIVSNGVFRIGEGASFPGVPRIAVADGGTLEITSEITLAMCSVGEITIEAGGRVAAPASAFAPKQIALSLEDGAELDLTDGGVLEVASLSIGGTVYPVGIYDSGSISAIAGGKVQIARQVSPDATGIWIGRGVSQSTMDVNNWEGGFPGAINITFAQAGKRALVGEALMAADLIFDTPESIATFEVAADDAAAAKIMMSGDLVMTNTAQDVSHVNTLSVPLVVSDNSAWIRVDGEKNVLEMNGGILGGQNGNVSLMRTGTGTLFLNAADSAFQGNVKLTGGKTYVKGGALGGTAAAPVSVTVNPNDTGSDPGCSPVDFYFTGGTYDQNYTFIRTGSGLLRSVFQAGSTNVMRGFVRSQNNYSFKFEFERDSNTTFENGFEQIWVYGYHLDSDLHPGAVVKISDKPLMVSYTLASFRYCLDEDRCDAAQVVFDATGNFAEDGVYFGGDINVRFDKDFAFDRTETGKLTSLAFLRLAGEAYNEKYVVMDLNGHDQRFGNLYTVPVGESDYGWLQAWGHSFGSCITSALPAVLYVVQEGDLINKPEVPWAATFRGAVSLVKSGTNTLTLAGVNSTTGRLEVAEGRLDFAGDGSWANAREIAVSGGVLALGRNGIISREADVYISGGSLEIAEGVRQTVRHLYISDGEGGFVRMRQGYYDSGSAGGFVTGGGVLRVRGDGGLTVVVR